MGGKGQEHDAALRRSWRQVTIGWVAVAAAVAFFAGAYVDDWISRRAYSTYAGCVLTVMRGMPANMNGVAARFCRDKVKAGEITE